MLVAVAGPLAVRDFLAVEHTEETEQRGNPLKAWTEPRTLLIGVFVFAAAFTEGTGNDWLAVATIDGYGAADALGSLTFALFLAAMTLGRWFGPAVLDRYRPRADAARALASPRSSGSRSSSGADRCRWRWRARSCGGSAPRSGSRSG